MNHVAEWKTPELVIHGGKGVFEREWLADGRLPID